MPGEIEYRIMQNDLRKNAAAARTSSGAPAAASDRAMNDEPLERFAYAAFPPDGVARRGAVVHFMGLGSQWQAKEGETPHGLEREGAAAAAAAGAIFLVPYLDPWNWMNAVAVEATDRIVALALARAGLPADAPVVSTGGSMGGLCALVWPRYTRRRVRSNAAGLSETPPP